jgi:predicted DNA-binding transcriptional regulator AlpA
MLEPLLKATQVEKILTVSLSQVYNLADSGLLPCVKWKTPGGKTQLRFRLEDVQEFINKHHSKNQE